MSRKTEDLAVLDVGPQARDDGRDLVNQLLGQAQMANTFSRLSQTIAASKLALVKNNKLYQQLKGMYAPNGLELKGTWIEFCSLLGMSDEKANQDIANVNAFGEEALDQMQRIGIGYRDLAKYRKLPDDEKTALVEAAKSGDKGAFVELAETLIAKHAKEKIGFANELGHLNAKLAATKIDLENSELSKAQLSKQLKRRAEAHDNELVPLAVADMRAEIAALVKKAQLAVDSVHVMGREIADLGATAPDWMQPTARLALAGLLAMREQIDGCLAKYVQLTGEERAELASKPASMAFLSPQEIAEVASDWQRLVATHEHEAALREYERKKAHPKGKGRPAAEPVAPGAGKTKGAKK
jgi:hypothetical protein